MSNRLEIISHTLGESIVNQRVKDGYINLNQIANACGKRIDKWLENKETQELLSEFESQSLNTPNSGYLKPLFSQRGKYGGTWGHPDIAIQFAQWCSPSFALQVSRWVRQWMTTGHNPLADIDRVSFRGELKDQARLNMTDQIKLYLEQIQKYDDKEFRGKYFAKVHNLINEAITTETSKQMRLRLSEILGKDVKDNELIRDYFPSVQLQQYTAICNVVANLMYKDCLHPLDAVNQAVALVLPINYVPMPINFVEHIKLTRQRVAEYVLDARRENLYRSLADK